MQGLVKKANLTVHRGSLYGAIDWAVPKYVHILQSGFQLY